MFYICVTKAKQIKLNTMTTTTNTKTTTKKFRICYYNKYGYAISYKFSKSIDTLILTKSEKKGLSEIDEYEFCPITKNYTIIKIYGSDEIDIKPNLI